MKFCSEPQSGLFAYGSGSGSCNRRAGRSGFNGSERSKSVVALSHERRAGFSGKLLTRLAFPLQIDYLHATRYRNNTQGSELEWHRLPALSLHGRDVLILDDILDEGATLAAVVAHCRAQGAARVLTAVLVDKHHERKVPGIRADFVGLRVEDRYLYGYGMDYRGYLRNAAGIYAVDPVDCD